ncbi:hypothetical protein SAMN05216389_101228 [Oceanobacillus limi]|uniref:Uncharacterized protein n=1 Tax=Oceanobacillus limi TaxID=930131 RepID=A0A1H9Y6V1_9BACI|nr:hypothetical protein [Oceanobacillus limi]SES64553.1 hypothetical protein SAMN05216389_101228 [Oceanobacillus limi]
MVYNVKMPGAFLVNLILFVVLWNIFDTFSSHLVIFLSAMIIAILLGSIRRRCAIYENQFVHEILFNKKVILKRIIDPQQMKQLKFIRVGWAKKGVKIKVEKAFPIKLEEMEPDNGYEHLMEFAKENGVSIDKTRDYSILERMNK